MKLSTREGGEAKLVSDFICSTLELLLVVVGTVSSVGIVNWSQLHSKTLIRRNAAVSTAEPQQLV